MILSEMRAFWPVFLAEASRPDAGRERLRQKLDDAGFAPLIKQLQGHVSRNVSWIAGPDTALEDVREMFHQALSCITGPARLPVRRAKLSARSVRRRKRVIWRCLMN
nr:hypothetical protein [Marinicella sp. W31]MDC2876255.1 hypothetical protein [Marinicella sp. W31]